MPSPLFLKDILRISFSCLKLLSSDQVFVRYSSQLKISALSDKRSQNWRIHKAGKILKAFLFSCWTSLGTISKRAKCCQTILLSRSSFLQNCWGFLSRVKQQTLLDRLTPKVWISYSSCQTLVDQPKIIFRMVVFNACANLYSRHMLNEKRCWTDWHQKSGFVFISLWISHSSCQTLVKQPKMILRVIVFIVRENLYSWHVLAVGQIDTKRLALSSSLSATSVSPLRSRFPGKNVIFIWVAFSKVVERNLPSCFWLKLGFCTLLNPNFSNDGGG